MEILPSDTPWRGAPPPRGRVQRSARQAPLDFDMLTCNSVTKSVKTCLAVKWVWHLDDGWVWLLAAVGPEGGVVG